MADDFEQRFKQYITQGFSQAKKASLLAMNVKPSPEQRKQIYKRHLTSDTLRPMYRLQSEIDRDSDIYEYLRDELRQIQQTRKAAQRRMQQEKNARPFPREIYLLLDMVKEATKEAGIDLPDDKFHIATRKEVVVETSPHRFTVRLRVATDDAPAFIYGDKSFILIETYGDLVRAIKTSIRSRR